MSKLLEGLHLDAEEEKEIMDSLAKHKDDFDTTSPKCFCRYIDSKDNKEFIALILIDEGIVYRWYKDLKRFVLLKPPTEALH